MTLCSAGMFPVKSEGTWMFLTVFALYMCSLCTSHAIIIDFYSGERTQERREKEEDEGAVIQGCH